MLGKKEVTSTKKVGGFSLFPTYYKRKKLKKMSEVDKRDSAMGYSSTDPVPEQKFLRMTNGNVITTVKEIHGCEDCYFVNNETGKCLIKDDDKKRSQVLTHLTSCATGHVIYKHVKNSSDIPDLSKIIDSAAGIPYVLDPKIDDYIIYEVDLPSGKIQAIGLVAQGNEELIVLSFVPGGESRIYSLDSITVLTIIQKK